MKTMTRTGLIASAAATTLLLGAPHAMAAGGSTSVYKNGSLKATATYAKSGWFHLCANLTQGYSATATMGGNSVTDYAAGGAEKCIEIFNVQSGKAYQLTIQWRGTGGDVKQNSTTVIAN